MEFGSEQVYDYGTSDDEVILDDDFSNPLYVSDDEDELAMAAPATAIPVPPPPIQMETNSPLSGLAPVQLSATPPTPPRSASNSESRFSLLRSLRNERAPPPPPGIPPPSAPSFFSGARPQRRKHITWDLLEPEVPPVPSKHRIRRADTNVLSINFRTLKEPSGVFTGEAEMCRSCRSVLSVLSVLRSKEEGEEKIWECEFCGHENEVDLMAEEIPTDNDVTFMLSPPIAPEGSKQSANQSLLIFCVDVSGSMAATTEVPGDFQLKEDPALDDLLKELNMTRAEYQQQIMHLRPAVTYVSRLKSLQSAVQSQLDQLTTTEPDKRVAIVTFNNEVSLLGDGTKEALILAGDKLYEEEKLFDAGANFTLPDIIKNTNQKLSETLWSLRDNGQTALGPALICSIALASKGPPGSRVLICTDGMANIGVGQLEDISTPEKLMEAQTYYEHIANLANEKGVTVSLLTITGTECRILELGQVADKTNGEVERVNPIDLMEGFSSILAKPILATNVSIRLTLHSKLYLREPGQENCSWAERQVGNVTEDSELTFEYGIRAKFKTKGEDKLEPTQDLVPVPVPVADPAPATDIPESIAVDEEPKPKELGAEAPVSKKKSVAPLMVDGREHLPFQLQITYTARDGSKCLRVVSQAMPVTKNREEAEKTSNLDVLQTHVIRSTADMALKGDFSNPRLKCLSNQKMVYRIGNKFDRRNEYKAWSSNVARMENPLFSAQKKEEVKYGRRLSLSGSSGSSSDEEMELAPQLASTKKLTKNAKKAKKLQTRASSTMSDTFSENLYKASGHIMFSMGLSTWGGYPMEFRKTEEK